MVQLVVRYATSMRTLRERMEQRADNGQRCWTRRRSNPLLCVLCAFRTNLPR